MTVQCRRRVARLNCPVVFENLPANSGHAANLALTIALRFPLQSVLGRRHAKPSAKHPVEMRDIFKATACCNLKYTHAGITQQLHGGPEPALDQQLTEAGVTLFPDDMGRSGLTQTQFPGQIRKIDGARVVLFDKALDRH